MRDAPIQRFRLFAVAALVAPLAGCAAEAGADRADAGSLAAGEPVMPAVSDSAGVRTMTHDAAAFDRAPRLEVDSAPLAVLGAPDDDPAYDLTNVSTVLLLADGPAMTLSRVGARVLLFRPDGRGERPLGRGGQGPGEFMAPRAIVELAGDTLLIPDVGNTRYNWATPRKGIVRSRDMPPDTLVWYGTPVGRALSDGRVVLVVAPPFGQRDEDEVWRAPCSLALLTPATAETRVLAPIRCHEVVTIETRYRGRRRLETQWLRLGRLLHVAVRDSTIVTANGDGFAFETRTPDAALVARVRVTRQRRPVTGEMRDAVIARELALYDDARTERMVDPDESRRLAREQPFADSLPPYSAIMTSRDGTLWVVDAIAPTDTTWSATAFRADGAIVGRLHASGRGRPMAFEGDRVAVRDEDADGIVTVRIHRIRPAAP